MSRSIKMWCLIFSTSLLTYGSTMAQVNTVQQNNPFFTVNNLPFQAAPFDKINDADFRPAFEEGFKLQNAEIQKITDNPDAPTFENTLVALEKSGQVLNRVNRIFNLTDGRQYQSGITKN